MNTIITTLFHHNLTFDNQDHVISNKEIKSCNTMVNYMMFLKKDYLTITWLV